jgi:hypothetical protein
LTTRPLFPTVWLTHRGLIREQRAESAGSGDSGHTHADRGDRATPREEAGSASERPSLSVVARMIARMLVDDARRRASSGHPELDADG